MRIVFAGTPEPAVPTLQALLDSPRHEVVAVLTRPATPQGRRRVLTPTPVADVAVELGLPVIEAARVDDAVTEQLRALRADLGVIVAYGALLRRPALDAPRLGWINLHFSDLPAYRGAAPVQRAVMAGDTVTAATVFQLVEALDAGPVFAREPFAIAPEATLKRWIVERCFCRRRAPARCSSRSDASSTSSCSASSFIAGRSAGSSARKREKASAS